MPDNGRMSPRIQIGQAFAELTDELLENTNTGNLSNDWNRTDMVRYALAELYKRTGKPLPKDCIGMLPRYYSDLDN